MFLSQRMFVVGHNVVWADENTEFPYPQMTFDMVGTTGNMYKTTIGKVPSCDCPDATKRGTLCKHICYGTDHLSISPCHYPLSLYFSPYYYTCCLISLF